MQQIGLKASRNSGQLRLLIDLVRVDAWISKLPALAIALLCLDGVFALDPAGAISIVLGLATLHLAIGYVANDLADWEYDIEASDERVAHSYGQRTLASVLMILIAIMLSAIAALWLWGTSLASLGIALAVCATGFTYSFGPRFKDRAFAGVVFSSLTQWVFPYLVVIPLLETETDQLRSFLLVGALGLWLLLLGVHGALRHQLRDLPRDFGRRSTFAVVRGPRVTLRAVRTVRMLLAVACAAPAAVFIGNPIGLQCSLVISTFAVYHAVYHKRLALHSGESFA